LPKKFVPGVIPVTKGGATLLKAEKSVVFMRVVEVPSSSSVR